MLAWLLKLSASDAEGEDARGGGMEGLVRMLELSAAAEAFCRRARAAARFASMRLRTEGESCFVDETFEGWDWRGIWAAFCVALRCWCCCSSSSAAASRKASSSAIAGGKVRGVSVRFDARRVAVAQSSAPRFQPVNLHPIA